MRTSLTGTVEFDHVSKRYRLGALGTLRGATAYLFARDRDQDARRTLWALRDVSFRVDPGQALALIGPNGAGKTTVLRLLSHVSRPTTGTITVTGRLSSLIELGAGFHPELSGLENIYLNGAILGLNRREINSRLDSIVEFSELERFLDTPVKRYSSGMYVRLGFAVAAHIEPDVLLVDEVLAVGDASFRRKCMERMEALRRNGTTILFVSHNMAQVRRVCSKALFLCRGEAAYLGDTADAIRAYEHHVLNEGRSKETLSEGRSSGEILVTKVDVRGEQDTGADMIPHDATVTVGIHYSAVTPITDPIIKVWLARSDGTVCGLAVSEQRASESFTLRGSGVVEAHFSPIQLVSGVYTAEVRIIDSADSAVLASGQSPWFGVEGGGELHQLNKGVFVPNVHWSLG